MGACPSGHLWCPHGVRTARGRLLAQRYPPPPPVQAALCRRCVRPCLVLGTAAALRTCQHSWAADQAVPAWSKAVKSIGGLGGLEHRGQWLGAQRASLFMAVLSCPEPPGAP